MTTEAEQNRIALASPIVMAHVHLDHIRKVYPNGYVAVHGASLDINAGEFVVLVGPSGCGKSTTLRMIAGLEEISSGTLKIGDRVVNEVAPKDRNIAMVFQNYALYPHMNVYDNMAFGLKLSKVKKAEIDRRVREAAAILSIEPILDRKPKQLSGGQRQRVALGRAIVRDAEVFLFDEPLSNLDAKLRVQMRAEIGKLHRTLGKTMIYVTHDQVEAMTMGDRIVVLKDGYVQQMDTPLHLYHHPVNRFVASFIGSPSMNFVEGSIVQDNGLVFREQHGAFTVPLDATWRDALAGHIGQAVTLGLRPEDFYAEASPARPATTAAATFQIDVLEPMGSEVVVYASTLGQATHQIVARLAPQPLPEAGQPITLALDTSKLHFFDTESEDTLAPGAMAVV